MHFKNYDELFLDMSKKSAEAERAGKSPDEFIVEFMSSHVKGLLDEVDFLKREAEEGGIQHSESQLYRVDIPKLQERSKKFMVNFKDRTFVGYNKPVEELKEMVNSFPTYTELMVFSHILAASVRAKSDK
jgi:hypothetical protein